MGVPALAWTTVAAGEAEADGVIGKVKATAATRKSVLRLPNLDVNAVAVCLHVLAIAQPGPSDPMTRGDLEEPPESTARARVPSLVLA